MQRFLLRPFAFVFLIGAQDAENRRVGAIADELRRLCQLYEAQRGDSQPHVISFETEQRVTEAFAKEHGLWLPIEKVFDLGIPGPSGNENAQHHFSRDLLSASCIHWI